MISTAERIFLRELSSKLATRKELVEKHGLSYGFVYKSDYMPAPVMTVSLYTQGLHLYDIEEVAKAQTEHFRPVKVWTTSEVDLVFDWRRQGETFQSIANRLMRSIDSVEMKYRKEYKNGKR